MRVTLLQSNLVWQDKEANLATFDAKLSKLQTGETDIAVLPEMFTTGFSMEPERWAEPTDDRTLDWMKGHAARLDAVVVGSFIAEDMGRYYNRLIWMQPNGIYSTYDKRHLFGLAGEDNHYSPGSIQLLVEWRGWKIMPLICYDLRFPVWSRNTMEYDMLLYVANWPERRAAHWRTLLEARAIENQCYCLGINRIGHDGNGIYHSGDTSVFTPLGECVYHLAREECVHTVLLDKQSLLELRARLPFLKDKDNFEISGI